MGIREGTEEAIMTEQVRDANPTDYPAIEEIHAEMGMDYQMPNLDSPLFIVKQVYESKDGRALAACFLRLTAECYLWMDPDLSPRDKVTVMEALQPEVLRKAWLLGLDDIEARIPRDLEERFHKRLKQLGWDRDRPEWHPWSRSTHMEAW